MNDCIKSNLPGFLYTFIMFWNPTFTPALFLGVMGYARFLFLRFVLSQWLMIQGTSGKWMFCPILVFHVHDILSSRLISDIYTLFQMVLDCLRVVVDVFEVVVGGCRWF